MIAKTIAALAHFASEPNMIGMGPTKTTPPPLTLVSPFADCLRSATIIAPIPTRTRTIPARTRSTTMRTGS